MKLHLYLISIELLSACKTTDVLKVSIKSRTKASRDYFAEVCSVNILYLITIIIYSVVLGNVCFYSQSTLNQLNVISVFSNSFNFCLITVDVAAINITNFFVIIKV